MRLPSLPNPWKRTQATPSPSATAPAASAAAAAAPVGPSPVAGGHFPVIVVGAGYGGAVSARRLAEAGIRTLLLEEGKRWDTPGPDGRIHPAMKRPDARAWWFKDRTESPLDSFLWMPLINRPIPRGPGVLERARFDNMDVFMGKGVGGGSLVNGGMAVVPPEGVFKEILPPAVDAKEMYGTYYPRAVENLKVAPLPREVIEDSEFYRYSRVARKQAEKAGFRTVPVDNVYDPEYLRKEAKGEVPRSALGDELLYGSNAGKNDLRKTYLAQALASEHVTLRPLRKVTRVEGDGSRGYTVTVREVREDGRPGVAEVYTCDRLILAAGSVGTSEILVRAKATGDLPGLNDEVGRGWGGNGNVMTARANHLHHPTGVKQGAVPAVGIDNLADPKHPAFAEVAPLPLGAETWVSMYLTLAKTEERGHFDYDAAQDRAVLRWGPDQSAPAREAAKALFDRMNAANHTLPRTDLFRKGAYADDFTYHPLGGAVIGKATDAYGRVEGYEGLYVNDGALIPGRTAVNPFVTITALAERNIEEVIARDIKKGNGGGA